MRLRFMLSLGSLLVPISALGLDNNGQSTGDQKSPHQGSAIEVLQKSLASATPVEGTVVVGEEGIEKDPFALTPEDSVLREVKHAETPADLDHQDPHVRFGDRIFVHSDGGETYITKPYWMPVGKAEKIVELIRALHPFQFRERPTADAATGLEPPLDPNWLDYQILNSWDEEYYSNLQMPATGVPPAPATAVVLSDLIVVTASYALLAKFEDFLDLFAAAGIPQIELEAKIIEVVDADQLDVGAVASFHSPRFVKGLDFNLQNVTGGAAALLELGAVQNSVVFDAVLKAISSRDNVQIDSRPKTVVRAGGVAYLESTTEIPYLEIKTLNTAGDFSSSTVYKKVGVQLYISPRVIGTKTLALDVHLIGSQQVGSQVAFTVKSSNSNVPDTVIEVPVIAYRTAKTVVYLEPGQTLVIGGLTTQRERILKTKVPVLGDVPLLGHLFRSHYRRLDKQHVLFAISPRILQNADFENPYSRDVPTKP